MDTSKITYDLPLFALFNQLRQAGFPLGIDEYQLLLRALQVGFGNNDWDALARLCKILWIKSTDEESIFDYYFEQMIVLSNTNETISQSLEPLTNELEIIYKEPLYKRIWYSMMRVIRRIFQTSTADMPLVASPSPTFEPQVNIPISNPDLIKNIEDEVEAAIAVSLATSKNQDTVYNYFIQTDEYFPITRRQMKQSWRYLRRPVREGPLVELDIEATVNEVGQQGMLLEPMLVPRRTNRTELLLLIDQDGSMVPFHALSRRLTETALRGGRLGKVDVYYFHNCPIEYIYHDPAHQEAETIQNILSRLHYSRTGVLIFSDAGAARGGLSLERIRMTGAFLSQLKKQTRYVAWLNPLPRSRWFGTTAAEVMKLVPMFDISRQGLDDSISVLRGHPTPYFTY